MNSDSRNNNDLIKTVEDTFTQVNGKIDGLLECSIKDFELLNKSFKNYHNLFNVLSDSTKSFFDFIHSSNHVVDISNHCREAEKQAITLNKIIKLQLSDLKGLDNKYNFILLSTNNLKQDISTLRLLFTNLRFDPFLKIEQSKIRECIDNLSESFLDCEGRIKKLFDKLDKITDFVEEGYRNGLELYTEIIDKINSQISILTSIHKTSQKYEKQIADIEVRKTSSASEIITNLQFQDILRQKIEHIQAAHTKITDSLYSGHTLGNTLSQQELSQIRDISSLQSALLVHANKEYQSAVEIILKRISDMRQLINSFNAIWNQFCLIEKTKMQNTFSKVKDDLSLLHSQSFSLNQTSEKYLNLLTEISTLQKETNLQITSNTCINKGIAELEDLIKSVKSNNPIKKKFSPIHQLETELKKFQNGYTKLSELITEFKEDAFTDYINSFKNSECNTKELNEYSNKITNLIKDFSKKAEKDIASAETSETIEDFGIEQVGYYKSFEKEVKEMIRLFDILLSKIDPNNTSDIDIEDLDKLKELYTMQSERDVHEKLTREQNDNASNEEENKDDNEVEFF